MSKKTDLKSSDRRDERNSKDETRSKPITSKKDTKKWCRGKVGVEHQPQCLSYQESKNTGAPIKSGKLNNWKVLVCTKCGKELDKYYGFKNEKKPDWVK